MGKQRFFALLWGRCNIPTHVLKTGFQSTSLRPHQREQAETEKCSRSVCEVRSQEFPESSENRKGIILPPPPDDSCLESRRHLWATDITEAETFQGGWPSRKMVTWLPVS